jgi:vacuolar protein sorting-associated protein 35
VLLQGFPDEFHLGTLDMLLGAVPQLQVGLPMSSLHLPAYQ